MYVHVNMILLVLSFFYLFLIGKAKSEIEDENTYSTILLPSKHEDIVSDESGEHASDLQLINFDVQYFEK